MKLSLLNTKQLINITLLLLYTLIALSQNGITKYPLPSMNAEDLVIDETGNKWIAFTDIGLGKFFENTWKIYNTNNSGIASNRILDIHLHNDILYLATSNGISIFNNLSWQTYNQSNGLPSNFINGIYRSGNLLYAATDSIFCVFNGTSWTNYIIPNSVYLNPAISPYKTSILKDKNGIIWIGRYVGGLYYFDGISVKKFSETISSVYHMIIDFDDRIWISAKDINGFTLYLLKNNQLTKYNEIYNTEISTAFSPAQSFSLAINKNGNIYSYFGYYNGMGMLLEISKNTTDLIYVPCSYSIIATDINNTIWYINKNILNTALYSLNQKEYKRIGLGVNAYNFKWLDVNQTRAVFLNRGDYFWDKRSKAFYEVPKNSGKKTIFNSGIWIGAQNKTDSLFVAAARYQENKFDFFPGPLKYNGPKRGTTDSTVANYFDRIWRINKTTIDEFRQNFLAGKVTSGAYTIPDDIAQWPADASKIGGNEYSTKLAPFVDFNNDGIYNPMDGDFPKIKGDQMLWWVFNDALAPHSESGGNSMGIEIQVSAYAINTGRAINDSIDLFNYVTFLDYKIINQSKIKYDSVFIGLWGDFDIGYAFDDYIGSNVMLNAIYAYNALTFDGSGQTIAYGANPPVQSLALLRGPKADDNDKKDNNRNGIIDEPDETIALSSFIALNESDTAAKEPTNDRMYYNYLNGYWHNGIPMYYGKDGHYSAFDTANIKANFMYPGNSDPYGFSTNYSKLPPWSQVTAQTPPDDVKGVTSIGPFTLKSGDSKEFTIAYITSRRTTLSTSYENYPIDIRRVNNWYNKAYPTSVKYDNTYQPKSQLKIYPNPTKDICFVSYYSLNNNTITLNIYNTLGKIIYSEKYNCLEGINTFTINTQPYNQGIYYILIGNFNGGFQRGILIKE